MEPFDYLTELSLIKPIVRQAFWGSGPGANRVKKYLSYQSNFPYLPELVGLPH